MTDRQRTFGQFETPPALADLLLSLCVRRAGDCVLDPSCGSGLLLARVARWQQWLAGSEQPGHETLWGVELDKDTVALAHQRLAGARIVHQNFFTIEPGDPVDAVVGNPPYTRAEWFERLHEHAALQLALFDQTSSTPEKEGRAIIPGELWQKTLSRRAGLHAYFILHSTRFLREGGRFGFVLPNNWLDVGYGDGLKQFLLQHFKIIALIESTAERWFAEARVNTCLLIMEKCSFPEERAAQLVRFVQLREPLARLLGSQDRDRDHFGAVEKLSARLLPAQDHTSASVRVRVLSQNSLRAREKWGLFWRAPAAYRHARRQAARRHMAPLKQWATIQRGFTTGANAFFYLNAETIDKWQIEPRFRRPLLKSLRGMKSLTPEGDTGLEVLLIAPNDPLAGSGAGAYVAWGERQGFHQRPTCRARQPWYALPHQEQAELVLAKGIWERHLAPLFASPLFIDQQLYRLAPQAGISLHVAAALLNSSWIALQLELHGRVNFGEGVLWLAAYEVENLLLPEPRLLPPDTQRHLKDCFKRLSKHPVTNNFVTELMHPYRQELDDAVFKLVGLSATEATIIQETLVERVLARQAHAR